MTAPTPCTDQADQTLQALALVEALIEDNAINQATVLRDTEWPDLLVGMTSLAKSLLLSLAACTSQTNEQTINDARWLFLHYGNPRSER